MHLKNEKKNTPMRKKKKNFHTENMENIMIFSTVKLIVFENCICKFEIIQIFKSSDCI